MICWGVLSYNVNEIVGVGLPHLSIASLGPISSDSSTLSDALNTLIILNPSIKWAQQSHDLDLLLGLQTYD